MSSNPNQPEVAPGVPGMNPSDLVNAPHGPEAKAAIARSQAERFDPGKCWRCTKVQQSYDNEMSMYEDFLGKKTKGVLGIGERPEVNEAKWRISFWSSIEAGRGEQRDICEDCCDAFAAEVVEEYDTRCAGLKGWKEAQHVIRRPIVPGFNKAGVVIRAEADEDAERYDVSLGRVWFRIHPESPKRYPHKRK